MTLDISKFVLASDAAGFGNSSSGTTSVVFPAQTMSAGAYLSTVASIPLNNANAVTTLTASLTFTDGTPNVTLLVDGFASWPRSSTSKYLVGLQTYYTGGNLNVFCYVAPGDYTVPTTIGNISITLNASVFTAPF